MFRGKIAVTATAFVLAGAATVFFSSTPAGAQSLGEKKRMKETEEVVQTDLVNPLQEKCGAKIPVSFDWKTWSIDWWDGLSASMSGYCGDAPNTVRELCEDGVAKAEVVKKIKRIVCRACSRTTPREPENKGRAVSLKNGTLEYTACPYSSNNADFIKAYLMKSL